MCTTTTTMMMKRKSRKSVGKMPKWTRRSSMMTVPATGKMKMPQTATSRRLPHAQRAGLPHRDAFPCEANLLAVGHYVGECATRTAREHLTSQPSPRYIELMHHSFAEGDSPMHTLISSLITLFNGINRIMYHRHLVYCLLDRRLTPLMDMAATCTYPVSPCTSNRCSIF